MLLLGQQFPDPKPPILSTSPAGLHFVKSISTPATYKFVASSRSESIFTVEKGKDGYGLWETLPSGRRVRIRADGIENASLGTDSFGDPVVIPAVSQPKQENASFLGFNQPHAQYVWPSFSIAFVNGIRYLSSAVGTTFNEGLQLINPRPEVVYPAGLGLISVSPAGKRALVYQDTVRRDPVTNKLLGNHSMSLIDLNSETPSMRPIALLGEEPFWSGALRLAGGAMISETEGLFLVEPAAFTPPKEIVETTITCGTFDFLRPRWLMLTHVDLETGTVTRLKAIKVSVQMPKIQAFGPGRQAVYQVTPTRFDIVRLDRMPSGAAPSRPR